MSVLIDRNELIKDLKKDGFFIPQYFMDIIKNQAAVHKWIPCTEELPKEFKRVHVTYLGYHDNKQRTDNCAYLKNGKWLWDLDDSEVAVKIIAWMPLMEPYKKEN